LVQWFGEDICKLILGINMVQIDITFLIVVTQEVKVDFMCFVFEWRNGFLATLMALVLSQNKGTRLNSNPKSLRVAIIQSNWE
jgi:hypothetical protein